MGRVRDQQELKPTDITLEPPAILHFPTYSYLTCTNSPSHRSHLSVLAPEVRVNAVCPGPINSRWIKQGNPDWDIAEMVADFPIPKASEPDDIADAVLFFSTGTTMATGQVLAIDGGQTL